MRRLLKVEAVGQVKVALAPIHQYGPLILLAVLFLPPLRPFLDSFLSGGQEMVYGFLQVLSGD